MPLRDAKLMTRELARDSRKPPRASESSQSVAEPALMQQRRTDNGQFRLQVDRQTKASYTTFEAAKAAALAVKKGHPNLHVAVHDGVASINTMIELPGA